MWYPIFLQWVVWDIMFYTPSRVIEPTTLLYKIPASLLLTQENVPSWLRRVRGTKSDANVTAIKNSSWPEKHISSQSKIVRRLYPRCAPCTTWIYDLQVRDLYAISIQHNGAWWSWQGQWTWIISLSPAYWQLQATYPFSYLHGTRGNSGFANPLAIGRAIEGEINPWFCLWSLRRMRLHPYISPHTYCCRANSKTESRVLHENAFGWSKLRWQIYWCNAFVNVYDMKDGSFGNTLPVGQSVALSRRKPYVSLIRLFKKNRMKDENIVIYQHFIFEVWSIQFASKSYANRD